MGVKGYLLVSRKGQGNGSPAEERQIFAMETEAVRAAPPSRLRTLWRPEAEFPTSDWISSRLSPTEFEWVAEALEAGARGIMPTER